MAALSTFLEVDSRTVNFQKSLFCLLQLKPFKNDEKCFLFHIEGSSRDQDI